MKKDKADNKKSKCFKEQIGDFLRRLASKIDGRETMVINNDFQWPSCWYDIDPEMPVDYSGCDPKCPYWKPSYRYPPQSVYLTNDAYLRWEQGQKGRLEEMLKEIYGEELFEKLYGNFNEPGENIESS